LIILFDGVCNLCNGYVNFVIKRDPKGRIRFAALQSAAGQSWMNKFGISHFDNKTILLIEDERYFQKSTAVLRILRKLNEWWPVLYLFVVVPPFIRNFLYDIVAKNRYLWFGKRESCRIATPQDKERFL